MYKLCRKQKYARELADIESSTRQQSGSPLELKQFPHTTSMGAGGSNRSTEVYTEENSAYNQLPAHRQ